MKKTGTVYAPTLILLKNGTAGNSFYKVIICMDLGSILIYETQKVKISVKISAIFMEGIFKFRLFSRVMRKNVLVCGKNLIVELSLPDGF
jgi:hypothetical protein